MADAFAVAALTLDVVLGVAVVDAPCDALLAAWLLLVDDVHPAIDNVATSTSTIIVSSFLVIQVSLVGKNESEA